MKVINLYQSVAPGSEDVEMEEKHFETPAPNGTIKTIVEHTLVPKLISYFPTEPNGIAVLVIPGGGYCRQVMNQEGTDVAEWLNQYGITAFVLQCRLPSDPHKNPEDVALMDAQRAVRLIRSHCEEWNIHANQIGVMGFSAGGHTASTIATCFNLELHKTLDEVDLVSARPDFCVLGYPAVCIEEEEKSLSKRTPEQRNNEKVMQRKKVLSKYCTDRMVTKEVPPVFLFDTDDDRTTLPENSIRFYLACRAEGVSAELHIFKNGGHGFGMGRPQDSVSVWKDLFLTWLSSTCDTNIKKVN